MTGDSVNVHRQQAPSAIRAALLTISDTRTRATDRGGDLVAHLWHEAGHTLTDRELVPDDGPAIHAILTRWCEQLPLDVVLITGGTGIAARDQTYETLTPMMTRALPGYGELFRFLSYQQIGAAAMLSRATGGLIGQVVVLTMPGSLKAIDLAMNQLILPEIGHLVQQARS